MKFICNKYQVSTCSDKKCGVNIPHDKNKGYSREILCGAINGKGYIKCIPVEYPRIATFLEAVAWMELGHKTREENMAPFVYVIIDNGILSFYDESEKRNRKLELLVCQYKSEWELLEPEKPEKTVRQLIDEIIDIATTKDVAKELKELIDNINK